MSFLKGLSTLPEPALWEWLAQRWHCTPGQAREEDENDIDLAREWWNAEMEKARQDAFAATAG